ncbi:unnamed protein product [Ixodes pacificus]
MPSAIRLSISDDMTRIKGEDSKFWHFRSPEWQRKTHRKTIQ